MKSLRKISVWGMLIFTVFTGVGQAIAGENGKHQEIIFVQGKFDPEKRMRYQLMGFDVFEQKERVIGQVEFRSPVSSHAVSGNELFLLNPKLYRRDDAGEIVREPEIIRMNLETGETGFVDIPDIQPSEAPQGSYLESITVDGNRQYFYEVPNSLFSFWITGNTLIYLRGGCYAAEGAYKTTPCRLGVYDFSQSKNFVIVKDMKEKLGYSWFPSFSSYIGGMDIVGFDEERRVIKVRLVHVVGTGTYLARFYDVKYSDRWVTPRMAME